MLGMTNKMFGRDNRRKRSKPILVLTLLLCIQSHVLIVKAVPETIRRNDLIIDLGEGVTTDAQITYPVVGDGPFPVVLLIPGGGLTDMDEYIPAAVTTNSEPAAPMKQIAEYLSERGFLVLRYNKRGITRNATMENYSIYSKATVETFKSDAERALEEIKANPMAGESTTLIGHSESSIIVTRMAADNPGIDNIVILGAAARDYLSIKRTQIVELRVEFAKKVLDKDNDGLVTLEEAVNGMESYYNAIIPRASLLIGSGKDSTWNPIWDPDGDSEMNLTSEFVPVLEGLHGLLSNPDYLGYNQTQAHISWGATKDMIGDLQSSILILQGDGDYQTPLVEALLLEQALIEAEHKDHTLYVYPGLSHFFYPTDGWQASMGPIETYVIEDLYQWLVSSERQMDDIEVEIDSLGDEITILETRLEVDIDSLNESISEFEIELEEQKDEGGNDYLIPVFTVIIVMIVFATRKRKIL
jgi:pimeloyl-ACP methyl ester carboxylesterase